MKTMKVLFMVLLALAMTACSKDEGDVWQEDVDYNLDLSKLAGTWILTDCNDGDRWIGTVPDAYKNAEFNFEIYQTRSSPAEKFAEMNYNGRFVFSTPEHSNYFVAPFSAISNQLNMPFVAIYDSDSKQNLWFRFGVTNIIDNRMSAYTSNNHAPWPFPSNERNVVLLRFQRMNK